MSTSKTKVIVSASAAFGGILLTALGALGILLFSGGHSVNAATGVTDPVAGQIKQVAIDTNITGNAPGTGGTSLLGPVDPVVANVPLGTTQLVDIIVDEVAPADGIVIGVGFNLHYDPAIVSINGHTFNYLAGAGAFEPGAVNDPDTSGNWREDVAAFSGGHTGEGIGVEVGIKCGNTIGSSTLTLNDEQTGNSYPGIFTKTNTNGDPTVAVPVNFVGNATIYCGEPIPTASPTPSPTPTASPTPSPSPTPTPVPSSATLTVSKVYSPAGPTTAVTVTPSCTNGGVASPLSQSVDPSTPKAFTITGFTAGATCSVSETGASGYTPTGCQGINMTNTLDSPCTITNTLNSATFTVNKDFVPNNAATVSVTLNCGGVGTIVTNPTDASEAAPAIFTVTGIPSSDSCTATEGTAPSGYTSSGCTVGVTLPANGSASCTITNTLNSATFTVHKDFSDKPGTDTTTVPVTLDCGGVGTIVAPNPKNASEAVPAVFTVTGIPATGATCTATEGTAPSGYTKDETACASVALSPNGSASCTITNGATATLTVSKTYDPAGPTTAVTVTPTCTSGNVVPPSASTSAAGPISVFTVVTDAVFTVTGFSAGATCTIAESGGPAGYAEDPTNGADTCHTAQNLTAGGTPSCNIVNSPSTTTFTVTKTFIPDDPSGVTRVSLACTGTGTITGGNFDNDTSDITGSSSASFTVTAFSGGDTCSVTEVSTASGYELTGSPNCTTVGLVNAGTENCGLTNQTHAPFIVNKDFSDNSALSVTASLACAPNGGTVTGGNVTASSGTLTETSPRTFDVTGFTPDPTCTATESPVPSGYSTDSPCSALLSVGACTITNTLRSATLTVSKIYSDATTTAVTVTPTCTSGAVSPSPSLSATPGGPDAIFTITGFNAGATCSIAESGGASGYAEDSTNLSDTCHSGVSLVANGTPSCNIVNSPSTTTFTVSKHFVPSNAGSVTVTLTCNGGIVTGGDITPNSELASEATPATFTVTAFTSGDKCTASESGAPAGYVGSGCVNVLLVQGATSCTLTNAIPPTPTPTPRITPTPVPTIHHDTMTPSPTPETFGVGDADCDGHLTPNDMLAILAYVAGTAPSPVGNNGCTPIGEQSGLYVKGDANCDGHVDAMDALVVLLAQAGLPLPIPSGCPGP